METQLYRALGQRCFRKEPSSLRRHHSLALLQLYQLSLNLYRCSRQLDGKRLAKATQNSKSPKLSASSEAQFVVPV